MAAVTLAELLTAKENRAMLREEMRQASSLPVLCFSVNCPGEEKDGPEVRRLLRHAAECFRNLAETESIVCHEERFFYPPTGPYALMAVNADPVLLKRLAVQLEDLPEYGRLLDIDVYDAAGRQLSRTQFALPLRSCYLCESDAISCMRERRHSAPEIRQEFQRRLRSFTQHAATPWPAAVWETGHWATEAMLMEAACTPAPGLVDRVNSGAHDDMDFFTFMSSTSALSATMIRCAAAGWDHSGPTAALLPQLRRIGGEGERNMFRATSGVNTQKGLIFLMGLLCAATGLLRKKSAVVTAEAICTGVAELCAGIVQRELETLLTQPPDRPLTAGERLYLDHRSTGIRGETEQGLPAVLQYGLPCLRVALAAGLSLNDALVHTLLRLMTVVEDTTILKRHDPATLLEVQAKATRILELGGMLTVEGIAAIHQLDAEFIRRWISPGGVADQLAAVYFLHQAELSAKLSVP